MHSTACSKMHPRTDMIRAEKGLQKSKQSNDDQYSEDDKDVEKGRWIRCYNRGIFNSNLNNSTLDCKENNIGKYLIKDKIEW